ncbi:3-isopropylmalate dehydratase small subunit [Allopusillimonas ginsengisoli]|uniref:3-isopropylmalate dehydratase small subunit n=1 Tax=Allopusillimonas ginsengisoli TaxID=453575 RepID=UPI0039C2C494
MQAFTTLTSLTVPVDRINVDTDAILPKQFMKTILRTGLGSHLFDSWRFLDPGEPGMCLTDRKPNPDFVLNQSRYQGASILLARDNFGCGSSREHAVWAIDDFGIRAIIAVSFADIFYNNCFKNGLLPITLDRTVIDKLFVETKSTEGYQLVIDLPNQSITCPSGEVLFFNIEPYRKHCLLQALDDISITLQDSDAIKAYERQRYAQEPWLFSDLKLG